ncbi:MAG: chromosomal replication initiator protein DnaA [Candidatus Zambryskibacteria bacterium CG_4_9_14_3_um_filter_40_16]|uniref:Chromosomal replication initiator protein DnaA n=2 Tax=Candidatus Zambryskiibacteriota TaxID=1817925 RepID=A0A2H0K726_9BACT|nr:MAG: chromosomal replication initiator protein DnaA [Candidatus Zambryskibacteria bacterium CG11_big_fil_rev_8_21_14_0_20_40_24]PJA33437.1 MAG: chromosomal replication initiator protein DnaA [Candidatus Zambryskibacteria bacterium CG_4_9_14_3_um_filter_40_16]
MELIMDNKQLWEGVLVEIELTVSKASFNTWFKDTYINKFEDGVVYLSVPNAFVKEWLLNKYHNPILKYLRGIVSSIHSVEYVISKDDGRLKESSKQKGSVLIPTRELPLQDHYVNREDNLNPRYTFENFVVGPFNELAHAASQAVIKKPGIMYNPLFIYGNTGYGKTHLVQSVGNAMKSADKNKKVLYVTSERFASDITSAIQTGKINQVKERYRKYDVLIMDDMQFFSNKEKTQEELFHLFNTLYDNNKQVVFTSDKHPNFILGLEDRLKSRFAAGMTVDIQAPDHESRAAILQNKARLCEIFLSQETLDYLAHVINGNIRDLEGVVNSIVCQSQLKGRELALHEIKSFVKTNAKPKRAISVKEVVKIVADFYQIPEENIYEKTRRKEIIKPRQVAMYILREDFSISYPSIGQKLGGRDHTTVIHSCEKIKGCLLNDAVLNQEIGQLRSLIV